MKTAGMPTSTGTGRRRAHGLPSLSERVGVSRRDGTGLLSPWIMPSAGLLPLWFVEGFQVVKRSMAGGYAGWHAPLLRGRTRRSLVWAAPEGVDDLQPRREGEANPSVGARLSGRRGHPVDTLGCSCTCHDF